MMCAFMTPVLKNDWEVYQTKNTPQRRRTTSDSPQQTGINHRAQSANLRRKVLTNEQRSMSFAGHHQKSLSEFALQRGPTRARHISAGNSRNTSRGSFSPENSGLSSPAKTDRSFSTEPKKSPSSSSLTRFHNKVMDKLKSALHIKDQEDDSKGSGDEEDNGLHTGKLS